MSWVEYHRRSEEFAEQAHAARRLGHADVATDLFLKAAMEELSAYGSLGDDKVRTIGITAVSAAALFFKGGDMARAEALAHEAMARPTMPTFARGQLREIIQDVWNAADREEAGVAFVPGQVTVSVKGGEVVRGGAPLELVLNKVQIIQSLYARTAELMKQLPFRRRGPPGKDIQDHYRPWLFQTQPGSYQFVVAVQRPAQSELFSGDEPEPELLTKTFLAIVRASADGTQAEIEDLVPDVDYRKTFLRLTRNLAPTGKTFTSLELRPPEGGEGIVLVPQSRVRVADQLKPLTRLQVPETDETSGSLRGALRAVDLENDWLEIVGDDGISTRVVGVGEVVDDVIGPMVNHHVTVRVIQKGRETRFVEIDIEE